MAIYKKLIVVKPNYLGLLHIDDRRMCIFQTVEIRNEMKNLQKRSGIFALPDHLDYIITLDNNALIMYKL